MDFEAEFAASRGLRPTPAQPGDFESQFSTYRQQQAQEQGRLRASALVATQVSPDAAAVQQQLSRATGLPLDVVRTNEGQAKALAKYKELAALAETSPVLRARLMNPEFTALAQDDGETLAGIESVVRKLGSAAIDVGKYAVSAPGALGGGLLSDVARAARAVASGAPKAGAGLYGVAAAPFDLLGLDSMGGFLRDQQKSANREADRWSPPPAKDAGILERGVLSGLQSAGQSLLMLPLGLAGGQGAMLGAMGATTAGQTYGKARDAGLSPARAIPYAVQDAAAEVITERFLGAAGFLKQVKAGASAGKLFMFEVTREVPGEMGATLWQNFNEWANLHPEKSVADFIGEQPAALAETVVATLVGGTTQIGAVKAVERAIGAGARQEQQAQQADATAQTVQELQQLLAASKLAQRAPESVAEFVRDIAESGEAPTELYVDAQQLANTLNQSAVTLEEIRAVAPQVAAQLESMVPGADVRMPLAELTALGPDLTAPLLDHLRASADAPSRAEAQEYLKQQGDAIRQQVEQHLAEHAEGSAFRDQVAQATAQFEQELGAVGRFPEATNKAYASLLGNFYAVQAQRAGVPLVEFMQRYRLQVRSQAPGGRGLEQNGGVATDKDVAGNDSARPAGDNSPGSARFTEDNRLSRLSWTGPSWTRIREQNPALAAASSVDDEVTIYRATIGDVIRPDDFVAVDRRVAQTELKNVRARDGGGKIISQKVRVRDLLMGNDATEFVYFPANESSAPAGSGVLEQSARGSLSFGEDITAAPSVIALLQGADLSTFIHESGHFFLEVQADLAIRIQTQISAGQEVTPGGQAIVDDFNKTLEWFGIQGDPQRTPLDTWASMSLEEKRQHHEQWARGFEAFTMEGKAPSLELQPLFARFRAWLVQVYKTLAGLDVQLTDDVRAVMGRLLASDNAIAEAQAARGMSPLFRTAEDAAKYGFDFAAWQDLQQVAEAATAQASAELDTRLLKDMKWLSRARNKALKEAQATADEARREAQREVRAEVMAEPIYRAWAFLTGKAPKSMEPTAAAETAYGEELTRWKAKRAEAEAEVVKDQRAALLATRPDLMGLERGQFLAKHKREVDFAVQQSMAEWDRTYPRPAKPFVPDEDLGPEFAVGKLQTSVVKDAFKAEFPRLRDLGMLSEERGIPPDHVAEMFGFASGEQLIQALAITPPPSAVIEELTDLRMLQQHGDIASPEALNRAADEAVHNALRARVIAAELKALAKANKVTETGDALYKNRDTVNVMAKAAEEYAAQVIARQQIKSLRPGQYAAAEARSARLAEQALGKDLAEAAMHKRNQLVNNLATAAAYAAQAEVRKGTEFFRQVLRGGEDTVGKSRDWALVQAARAILAGYGVGARGERANQYLESMARYDPDTAQTLRERVALLTDNAKPLKDLTVEEFRGLVDELKALWHMAKRSRQIEIDGQLMDIEHAKAPLVERMEAIGVPPRIPGEGHAVTDGERRIGRIRSAWAALRRVEQWADAKDGSTPGPFRKFIWQPIRDAADRYRTDKARFLRRYQALLAGLDIGRGRIAAPELGYTFGYSRGGSGKAEILHALLHTGNASNKRKLLLGRGWATERDDGSVDTAAWDRFVQRMIDTGTLTKADFDFAQGVWDLLEEIKPLAQKAHRDVFGRYFDEVTAEAFSTPFGTYRGGYVPAMTDAEVVTDAQTRALQEQEGQTLAYAFPSTARGFTKARVEYNKPLLLDLRVLGTHIDKVILFSHMEQPIREVRRIITSKAVADPLHRLDPAAFDGLLTPWMNRAARQSVETPVPGDNGLMRVFSKLRARAGMAAMFANLTNTAQQITGFSVALLRADAGHQRRALIDYVKAPRQFVRAVAAASPYMATRMDNEVQAMNYAIDEILLNPSVYERTQQWFAQHAYFMQSAIDNVMSPIVWTAAYNQHLQAGRSEPDARRLADAAVRQTQGSTLPEDISRIESGNAFARMFTQFAGYFNMLANTMGTDFAVMMREQGLRAGMGRGLYIFAFGFMVPAMVSEMIVQAARGGPDDEDGDGVLDDWLLAVFGLGPLRTALAMVPGVGQVANAAVNAWNRKPYDDRISTAPAISIIESAVSAPHSVYKAVVDDTGQRRAVRDLASLISVTTGIPANAIARPLGYAAAVNEGKVQPTSGFDAARGMVTGTPSPDSKR